MDQLALTLSNSPTTPRRRGRPPGAKSKRSLDLARYIEATFAGATPGQQAAQLAMVTPKDLREAKAAARELGIIDHDLPPLTLAMVVKAKRLALALGIEAAGAWMLIQKEREGLMAYVHQKQAQAVAPKGGGPAATVFLIPEGEAGQQLADFSAPDPDDIEFVGDLPEAGDEVG